MPAQAEYSAPAWGQSVFEDFTVPSGGLILVKRLDFQDVIAAGLMDEFDQLSPTVEEKVIGPAKGKRPQDRKTKKLTKAQQAEADRKSMVDDMPQLARLMAQILPVIVKKPAISSTYVQDDAGKWVQIEPEDREPGMIYVDSIPLTDQMAILEWAMEGINMSDLKRVREQPVETVGSVDPVPEPAPAPVEPVRDPE